jgi:hypothetical protein
MLRVRRSGYKSGRSNIIGWKSTGEGYMKTTVNQSPHFAAKSAQLWSRQAETASFLARRRPDGKPLN